MHTQKMRTVHAKGDLFQAGYFYALCNGDRKTDQAFEPGRTVHDESIMSPDNERSPVTCEACIAALAPKELVHAKGEPAVSDGAFKALCCKTTPGITVYTYRPGLPVQEWHPNDSGRMTADPEKDPITCKACIDQALTLRTRDLLLDGITITSAYRSPEDNERVQSESEAAALLSAALKESLVDLAHGLLTLAHLPRRYANTPGRKWLEHAQVITPWGTGMKERAAGNPEDTISATHVLRRPSYLKWAKEKEHDQKPPMEDVTDLICEEK